MFDATTGAYKRHWGAYGKRPDDGYFTQAGEQIAEPVQRRRAKRESSRANTIPRDLRRRNSASSMPCALRSDGLVYVCDRTNDRIQVFRKDGTFVKEAFIAKDTLGSGSVWDIAFSIDPAQTVL